MNINSQELLLLNKKIRFAGEQAGKPATTNITVPAPDTDTPQTGMNALIFQGLNNVVSDPQLAGELKFMKEATVENTENTENKTASEYVAPYQSNLAFQGKASKLKNFALAALMGLATLSATSTLTSCDDKEYIGIPGSNTNNVTVNVDLSAITALFQQMQEMWQQMLEQQQITNEQLQQYNEFMQQLLAMFQQSQISANEFYEQMYTFITGTVANQEIIINLLIQNGLTQEEANAKLDAILEEVRNGNLSIAQAMEEILNLLNNISVNLDSIKSLYEQMQSIWEQMLEQQQITNSKLEENNQYMQDLIDQYEQGQITANEFYNKMYSFMLADNVNQRVIISLLIQNGMSQNEANQLIKDLIAEVEAGNKTASEALQEIIGQLGDIKDLLSQAISDFNKYYEEMLGKQDMLISVNQQGFEELIQLGNISNSTLNDIKAQNENLIELNEQASAERDAIKDAIEKANLDSNANFETVINTLNINKNELISALMKMGYTQAQIEKMTAAQIINAIDRNSAITAGTNAILTMIANQLQSVLPELLEQNKITNEQLMQIQDQMNNLMYEVQSGNLSAEEFYQKAFNFMVGSSINQQVIIAQLVKNGKTQQEANNLIKQLISDVQSGNKTAEEAFNTIQEILGDIDSTLDDISATLKDLLSDFDSFYNDYKNDKALEFKLLGQLIQNGKLQTSILQTMNETLESMSANINGIKTNTDKLLEISQDDTKFQELINAIKNIQTGGSSDIDYQKLEDMFKLMGITIADAINMSSSQLEQAIKDFQKTYIDVEQKQIEELQTIQSKIDDLQMFLSDYDNNQEIIEAINNLTVSIGMGNEDVTNELKNLSAQLDKLQQAIDAIYKEIGNQASMTNTYFEKWDAKFDSMLGSLVNLEGAASDIKSQLATIIANQRTTQVYFDSLLKAIEELKEEIQKLQDATGGNSSSITLEQLEELWQQHDEANYNKYKELIENLDLNVNVDTSTIEDLLASIDAKMEYINDNSEILTQILNKLNSIDWSNPDYTDKLDRIIEILENFKCNCECGNNNEGIIGDLDDVLG